MADHAEPSKRLKVLVFPGACLMEFTWLSAGSAIVRCPGCGASHVISIASPPASFVHGFDDCPILRCVEAAIAMFEVMVGQWD
jgi:hypothetical protein